MSKLQFSVPLPHLNVSVHLLILLIIMGTNGFSHKPNFNLWFIGIWPLGFQLILKMRVPWSILLTKSLLCMFINSPNTLWPPIILSWLCPYVLLILVEVITNMQTTLNWDCRPRTPYSEGPVLKYFDMYSFI